MAEEEEYDRAVRDLNRVVVLLREVSEMLREAIERVNAAGERRADRVAEQQQEERRVANPPGRPPARIFVRLARDSLGNRICVGEFVRFEAAQNSAAGFGVVRRITARMHFRIARCYDDGTESEDVVFRHFISVRKAQRP